MLKKIIVVGYYGYDNLGDDLMLWCFLKEMSTKLPDVEISLLSKPSSNLDKICENFENVTLKPFKINSKLYNIRVFLKAILSHDLTIWGGGTCFSEEDGIGNYRYFLLNTLLNKPYAYLGIGIGNLKRTKSLKKTKFLLERAEFVTFRDEQSFNFSKRICHRGDFYLTADLAYINTGDIDAPIKKPKVDKGYILVSLRELSKFFPIDVINERHKALQDFLIGLIVKEEIKQIIFLPIDTEKDLMVNKTFMNGLTIAIDDEVELRLIEENDLHIKMDYVLNADLNITERLHSMVISEFNNVPCVSLSYSPKIDRFYNLDLGEDNYVSYETKLSEKILWGVYERLEKESESGLEDRINTLSELGKKNIEILTEYLYRD